MNDPLISIVLTNYNGEKFIGEAIESVLAQTYKNWELIIIDDCSADQSVSVIQKYQDPRIQLHVNSRNTHVAAAHEAGNQLVRGDYVAALDNDDVWKPQKLETQLHFLESHPEFAACFAWPEFIDEKGELYSTPFLKSLYCVPNRSHIEWIHDLLTTGNHFCNDGALLRTSVMREAGKENVCFLQLHDFHFWIRVILKHPIYLFETPLMYYRKFRESGSITADSTTNENRSDFEFCQIIGNTVLHMEPDLFRQVFASEMKCPDAETEAEILCEKAFLLAGDVLHENCRFYAFSLFDEMFRDPALTRLLEEKYHFNQHNVYRMTGQPIICSKRMQKKQARLDASYQELKNNYDRLWETYQKSVADIHAMQNSTSWKITAPLRAMISLLGHKK